MNEFTARDFGYLMLLLWRSKWLILFVTLSGLFAGLAISAGRTPETHYRAVSSVCVTYTTYQEQLRGSSVITSYSDLVASNLVCQRAAELINDEELTSADIQKMIDSWVSGNSYIMYINATALDPLLAILTANAVAQAFTEKVSAVSGNNSLQLLDAAQSASALANAVSRVVLFAALGPFVIACALIILREAYGAKVRFISQCADDQDEILGVLPDMNW